MFPRWKNTKNPTIIIRIPSIPIAAIPPACTGSMFQFESMAIYVKLSIKMDDNVDENELPIVRAQGGYPAEY